MSQSRPRMKYTKCARDELIRATLGYSRLRSILSQATLYADDIVLAQDLTDKLQEDVVESKEELGRKGLKLNINNSKVMHVGRKGEQSLRITSDGGQLDQVKEYEYLGVNFVRDRRIEHEISDRLRKPNSVYYKLCYTAQLQEKGNQLRKQYYRYSNLYTYHK